ncbi:hypothetical protein ACRALDRAFT_2021618 [Sodiomyces alcalophilus JCM 7366]
MITLFILHLVASQAAAATIRSYSESGQTLRITPKRLPQGQQTLNDRKKAMEYAEQSAKLRLATGLWTQEMHMYMYGSCSQDNNHSSCNDEVRHIRLERFVLEYLVIYVVFFFFFFFDTYDHTHWKARDPVRSPIDKPRIPGDRQLVSCFQNGKKSLHYPLSIVFVNNVIPYPSLIAYCINPNADPIGRPRSTQHRHDLHFFST